MQIVSLTTQLNASPERVWEEVNKSRLLVYVAYPIIRFRAVDPSELPENWEERDYVVDLRLFGVVPLGKQVISLSRPKASGDTYYLRDNGHSSLIRRWDHLITVSNSDGVTRYTDHIEIEAGLLTTLVAAFARRFYTHRQARWRHLVDTGFDYSPR